MTSDPASKGQRAGAGSYQHLLSEARIGSLTLSNRIVHAPMSLGLGAGDGSCGERFLAYYEARARGGVGLVNIGTVSIGYPEGSVDARQIALSEDRHIPGIRELAERVHRHGARIMLQLNHNGLIAGGDRAAGRPLAAPSHPVARPNRLAEGFLPEELEELARVAAGGGKPPPDPGFQLLDRAAIDRIVAMFAAAAARARAAGVDAVELHAGHGYLLSSFLSPATNRRDDEYGGPIENRARFLIDTIVAVRAAVGAHFPIVVKLDGIEFGLEGGITIEDAIATAQRAQSAGADAITATGYADMGQPMLHSGAHTPEVERLLVPYAEAIRRAVTIPVLTAGRIEPEDADADIAAGRYDFVAFGRKLLADPDLPLKLIRGEPAAIRPCIYCYACISQAYFRRPVICAVNPDMGFEDVPPAPAPGGGRVTVIGGGVGGMEAAGRLARAGRDVTLLDQGDMLGGRARLAAFVHPPIGDLLDWLEREVRDGGVNVHLETAGAPQFLSSLQPAEVVIATGGAEGRPALLSRDGAQSIDPALLTTLSRPGTRVAIIGGGQVGMMIARHLVRHGVDVSIIDEAPRLGAGLPVVLRWRVLGELEGAGAALHPGATAIVPEAGSVSFVSSDGAPVVLNADAVLLAAGLALRSAGSDGAQDDIWTAMHSAARATVFNPSKATA